MDKTMKEFWKMKWASVLLAGLMLGISGCGAVGSSQGTAAASSAIPPSTTTSFRDSTNITGASGITATIPSSQTKATVVIKIPVTAATPLESQALTSQIDQLNQLLHTLQHP